MSLICCPSLHLNAMRNTLTKRNRGEKNFISPYTSDPQFITEAIQGRNSSRS